jgi:pimeloyl-ACP methyl ester carboxylesterase
MPFTAINGQKIYFEDSGGKGLPVVLGHGFLMDHEMFAPQVTALAPEFRLITWDERGFGRTEFDGKPFTYWDSARDCLGLMSDGQRQGDGGGSARLRRRGPDRGRGACSQPDASGPGQSAAVSFLAEDRQGDPLTEARQALSS